MLIASVCPCWSKNYYQYSHSINLPRNKQVHGYIGIFFHRHECSKGDCLPSNTQCDPHNNIPWHCNAFNSIQFACICSPVVP